MSNYWTPEEIVIHEDVVEDKVTLQIIDKCPKADKRYVSNKDPEHVKQKSFILKAALEKGGYLNQIHEGKKVLYISPPGNVVNSFELDGSRMVCPEFKKLRFSSNGCFYRCEWCYLKGTYRTLRNYMTVYANHEEIKKEIKKNLNGSPILFNTGEMADSLALEHLTGAAQEFIPWFAEQENGYMYMLTKSTNVDNILDLNHGRHTIVAWSINNAEISHKFEIGAPAPGTRLEAARKVKEAGYPVRIRLDPIVPVPGWQEMYAETIKDIFNIVNPERITVGTLRFESGFYNQKKHLISPDSDLLGLMENMTSMFTGEDKEGKRSFPEAQRIEIFRFITDKIKECSGNNDYPIALCKESPDVWNALDMDLSKCGCVCQLDTVDMSNKSNNNNATDYIEIQTDTEDKTDKEISMDQGFNLLINGVQIFEHKPNKTSEDTDGELSREEKRLTGSGQTVYNEPEDISTEFPQEEDEQLEESKYLTQEYTEEHTEEETKIQELIIDEELRDLIPELTGEEKKQLEDNIKKDGCRDAIIIWEEEGKKIIIDGMNRYKICLAGKIQFRTKEMNFSDRTAVRMWIIDNQLGRRNLTEKWKSYLRGTKYNEEKIPHEDNFPQNKVDAPKDHSDPSVKLEKNTAARLAKEYKVSPTTIKRDAIYAKAVDAFAEHEGPEMKTALFSGESQVPKKIMKDLANSNDKDEQKEIIKGFRELQKIEISKQEKAAQIFIDNIERMGTQISKAIDMIKREQLENILKTINKVKAEMEAQLAKMNEQQA